MQFTNEFTIPLDIDDVFHVLTDLEQVAPCMPGATLEEVNGEKFSGRLKVKVGPMSLTYQGTAALTERDAEAHTARIEAAGQEKRGGGTASADVYARLEGGDGETQVIVTTDIDVTGKPAQFGRGVMADVGAKIIDRFAANLREMLEAERPPAEAPPTTEPSPGLREPDALHHADRAPGPRKVKYRAPRDEALDLVDVAGEATAKRLAPIFVGVLLILVVVWLRRRDGPQCSR